MKPRLAHLIDMRFKYTPANATNVAKTIAREIKRRGVRPVVRVVAQPRSN